jgi:hypothetical protein
MTTQEIHDAISAKLVEIGLSPAEANQVVETVLTAVEAAASAAVMTLDLNCLVERDNALASKHLGLQLLIARLTRVVERVGAELERSGATSKFVSVGVDNYG